MSSSAHESWQCQSSSPSGNSAKMTEPSGYVPDGQHTGAGHTQGRTNKGALHRLPVGRFNSQHAVNLSADVVECLYTNMSSC